MLMEGKSLELAPLFSPERTPISSAAKVLAEQIPTARDLAERVLPASEIELGELQPGQGAVGNVDGIHTAACRDHNGCLHQLSPIRTHMGGVLRWNEVEQT